MTSSSLLNLPLPSGMSADELKSCRVFFNNFDRSKSGCINGWELQCALEAMGQNPSEMEIRTIIQALGGNGIGMNANNNDKQANNYNSPFSNEREKVPISSYLLDFTAFLKSIQLQRELEKSHDNESDFLHAFNAMGGNLDRSGCVSSDRLRKVIKEDFALTFKIDELLEDLDTEQDGLLNYAEFKQLFS